MFAGWANKMQTGTDATTKRGGHAATSGPLEKIAFYGLVVTVLVSSIPYGTAAVWHKSLLVVLISVFAGFRVLDGIVRSPFRVAEPLMLLPVVGVLCLAIIQAVLLPGLDSALSVDPYETKSFILTLGGLIVASETLFFYTSTRARVKCLIGIVIAVGVGSAIFGISRDIYFDTQTDLLKAYLPSDGSYAQFINRNHFAFLAEMTFGLLVGILIKGKLSERLRFCGWVFGGILLYATITANSRGGIIGITVLALIAVPLHLITRNQSTAGVKMISDRRGMTRRLALKISGAACLCIVVFVLMVTTIAFIGGDAVVSRIEKIESELGTVDSDVINRKHIWTSTIELFRNDPILGAGFGGYAAAITRFDSSGGEFSLEQAHNDYLEILANGGIIGFALFGAFAAIVFSRILKNLTSSDPFTQSTCFGAVLGISGVLIHSLVDFGLHILINALILAVLVVIATTNRVVRDT